jgi:hypothetical protein
LGAAPLSTESGSIVGKIYRQDCTVGARGATLSVVPDGTVIKSSRRPPPVHFAQFAVSRNGWLTCS